MDLNTIKITEEQFTTLCDIWKYHYPPSTNTLGAWLDWITTKDAEKDIKKINESLTFFKNSGFDFKDFFVSSFNKKSHPNALLPNFSYCTIFNFLQTNNLISENELPITSIINGVDQFYKKSRFHRENQIKLLLTLSPTEERINKILDCYYFIHNEYTIDLSEQKKILKIFNQYAGEFVKTLDCSSQTNIFKKLDFICSGLNNNEVKDIDNKLEEEYSFRFIISVNNTINKSYQTFTELKSIFEVVIEKIKDDTISEILFKEINSQTKLGVLKFQYVFFSKDKESIDKYCHYFKEFNPILTQDALNSSLAKDTHYVEVFNKICFKYKLSDKLEPKNTTAKSLKI